MRTILSAGTAPTLLLVDDAHMDDRGIADLVAAWTPQATVEARTPLRRQQFEVV